MFFECASLEDALSKLAAIPRQADEALLVLVAEQGAPDLGLLVAGLRERGCRFFGGLFPGLTDGRTKRNSGIVALPLRVLAEPCVVAELSASFELPPALSAAVAGAAPDRKPTALVFVDGLSEGIAPLLHRMYDDLGNSVAYIGGGAGSLSLRQAPCVFCADGVFADAAVVAISPLACSLGVRHGWLPIAGPLVATRTQRNRVEQLNWETAFPVYCRIVEQDSQRPFQRDRFFEFAREFPFGLFRDEQESVVRDPIQVDVDGALVCVGPVPENSVLHILKGVPNRLVEAAAQAARDAARSLPGRALHSLLIDCISRAIFLGDRFEDELGAVRSALAASGAPAPVGALTLGEISCRGDGYLEFYNKTAVVGVLHDR